MQELITSVLQNKVAIFFFHCDKQVQGFISDLGEEKCIFLVIYSFRWLGESEASRNTLRTAVTLWLGDLAFLKNDANVMIIHEAQTRERFRNTIQFSVYLKNYCRLQMCS